MRTALVCSLLVCSLVSAGCSNAPGMTERTRPLLGTIVTVRTYACDSTDALTAIDAVYREMARVDSICGYEQGSEVARINHDPVAPSRVSSDVAYILERAIEYARVSDGALDVTIDPVMQVWHRFEDETAVPPSSEALDSALDLVDYRNLILEDSGVRLVSEGSIDLGSIAKGYAVDRGIAVMDSLGVAAGLIDAGGDIRTLGKRPRGGLWRIGLRDPRKPDEMLTVFQVNEKAITTSGDYERYFVRDGVRYHHILDPKTGKPARGCCSVTIITEDACDADAIATAVFVMGPDKGMALIESLPDVEGLIVVCHDHQKRVLRSGGMAEYEK